MPYTSFAPVEVSTETVALKTVDVLVSVEVTNAHGGEEIIRGTFERRQLDPDGKTVRVLSSGSVQRQTGKVKSQNLQDAIALLQSKVTTWRAADLANP
jgi:hypothetical protein